MVLPMMQLCELCDINCADVQVFAQAHFGRGNGDILLDDLRCDGSEATLASCSHRPFGDHNCVHFEDAGVRCESQEFVSTFI